MAKFVGDTTHVNGELPKPQAGLPLKLQEGSSQVLSTYLKVNSNPRSPHSRWSSNDIVEGLS